MNILITGASRGIGYDTVKVLAKDPKNKIIALSRNESSMKELAKVVAPNTIQILPLDLTNFDEVYLYSALSEIESIDLLVNNAGLLINKSFEELSIEEWKNIFDVNVFGIVHLIKALLPKLKHRDGAHILNISSMGGVQGSSKFPGLSAYSASKAAVINMTECLAEELKEDHIKVNCLALGAVQTEMLAEAFPDYKAPLTSQEMANYISWFALNGHHFHNGKVIPVAVSTP